MSHVSHLSRTIGHRQVGTPGLEEAEAYLRKEAEKIAGVCEVTGTCEAKVSVSTVSGAFQSNKTGSPLYLSYAGLRNVLLTISPKGSEAKDKALLVNAHFDSALGSPGAADCASCVAVALESARALASSPDPPKVAIRSAGLGRLLLCPPGQPDRLLVALRAHDDQRGGFDEAQRVHLCPVGLLLGRLGCGQESPIRLQEPRRRTRLRPPGLGPPHRSALRLR